MMELTRCSSARALFLLGGSFLVVTSCRSSSASDPTDDATANGGSLAATGGASALGGDGPGAGTGGTLINVSCPGDADHAFQGAVSAIPGTVEAENFDPAGYMDSSLGNEGAAYRTDVDVDIKALGTGYAVGWMTSGEWLEYTVNVAVAGEYDVTFLAGAVDAGRTLELSSCGTTLGTAAIVQIADWGTVSASAPVSVHLDAGIQVLRVTVGASDYIDFDSMTFTLKSASGGTGGGGGTDGGGTKILAATPPMGWNSWNTFQCTISESVIQQMADAMVSSGMKDVGYEYVVIDDCWMDGRDVDGKLRWNASKFPAGMPALADYIHGKGLKFGIYEAANNATCLGVYGGVDKAVAVGSLGHEAQDAATFAEWGVDFVKYDLCAGQRSSIVTMGTALKAQQREILYSINPGNGEGDLDPPKAAWDMAGVANMWRIGFDINASWAAVIRLIDQNANLYAYAHPGAFNDPDMLEVGKLANADEDRAHFTLWAIMAAPLIAGNDLRSMTATTKAILTNPEAVAIDQDPLGNQGRLVASPGTNLQIWSKVLTGTNVRAVALFNRGSSPASITVQWSDLGLPTGSATVRDVWGRTNLGSFSNSYTGAGIPAHGAALLHIESTP